MKRHRTIRRYRDNSFGFFCVVNAVVLLICSCLREETSLLTSIFNWVFRVSAFLNFFLAEKSYHYVQANCVHALFTKICAWKNSQFHTGLSDVQIKYRIEFVDKCIQEYSSTKKTEKWNQHIACTYDENTASLCMLFSFLENVLSNNSIWKKDSSGNEILNDIGFEVVLYMIKIMKEIKALGTVDESYCLKYLNWLNDLRDTRISRFREVAPMEMVLYN